MRPLQSRRTVAMLAAAVAFLLVAAIPRPGASELARTVAGSPIGHDAGVESLGDDGRGPRIDERRDAGASKARSALLAAVVVALVLVVAADAPARWQPDAEDRVPWQHRCRRRPRGPPHVLLPG